MVMLKRWISSVVVIGGLFGTGAPLGAQDQGNAVIENSLIEILRSDAPQQEKAITCKRLAIHGTKDAVGVLQPLLADPEIASWARIALEAIPDSAADEALRQMLVQVQGRLRIGIIHSLGVRRDAAAVESLAQELQDAHTEIASAAAIALGKIGGPAASEVLARALVDVPNPVRSAVAEGCVLCAEQWLAQGASEYAVDLYDKVRQADVPRQRVIEATRGAILARGEAGIPLLVKQLQSQDKRMFYLGLQTVREISGPTVTAALVHVLEQAIAERQSKLLLALAERNDATVLPAVRRMVHSTESSVRTVAVEVLGEVGDSSCISDLVTIAQTDDPELYQVVQVALQHLSGERVDEEIINRLRVTHGKDRLVLIHAVAARRIAAVSELLKLADDPDTTIRQAALSALGETISPDHLPALISRVVTPTEKYEADNKVARQALLAACIRMPDQDKCVQQLVSAMGGSDLSHQSAVLEIIGSVGGKRALQAMSTAAFGEQPELQDIASRLLGKWLTVEAAPVLLRLAESNVANKYRTRGLRGYIRIVRQFPLTDVVRVQMCADALRVAERDAERDLILQVLKRYPNLESLRLAVEMTKRDAQRISATHVCLFMAQKIGLDSEPTRSLLKQIGHSPVDVQIVKAEYGDREQVVDVTAFLAEYVHELRLVNLPHKTYNENFGDPVPGVKKQLKVVYRIDGELANASFNEDAMVLLPLP